MKKYTTEHGNPHNEKAFKLGINFVMYGIRCAWCGGKLNGHNVYCSKECELSAAGQL